MGWRPRTMARFSRQLLACLLALAASAGGAVAQSAFPSRLVTIVVGYPAGGPTDIYARVLAKALSDHWKRPVVVENKGGASGTIGGVQVLRATPDGHMLFFTNNATN